MSESTNQFDVHQTTDALRKAHEQLEKANQLSSDKVASLKTQVEVLTKKIDEHEIKNQELVKQLSAQKEANTENLEKMKALETAISRYGSNNSEYKEKSQGIKALENFLAHGMANEVTKGYLRTDNNINGGFLMKPVDFNNMIIKPITEISPIRQYAKVRQVNSLKAGEITRDFLVQTYWTKEGATRTQSNSQYGRVNIMAHSQSTFVKYTQEAALDSMFDIENEIQSDIIEDFTQQEGAAFVNGDGVDKPQGFMTAQANVPRVNSGVANSFNFDSLIKLTGELKTGYNPMFGMDRKTIAFVRTLKANDGQYYWQPSGQAGKPNTILGIPYVEIPDMPSYDGVTANAENVIYADFRRLYEVADSYQAIVVRDNTTYQVEGKLAMIMHRFVGGGVILPEAGVILRNAS